MVQSTVPIFFMVQLTVPNFLWWWMLCQFSLWCSLLSKLWFSFKVPIFIMVKATLPIIKWSWKWTNFQYGANCAKLSIWYTLLCQISQWWRLLCQFQDNVSIFNMVQIVEPTFFMVQLNVLILIMMKTFWQMLQFIAPTAIHVKCEGYFAVFQYDKR